MGLVPVRGSIVRGYTFLFARFFTVVGLGWLPATFYGIACTYLIRAVTTGALGAPPASGAFNQYTLGYLLALLIVTAFFGAPMLIPFTREALGMHEEPVAAHFSYGPREWRLFVALLRFYGLVGGGLFLLIVASGIGVGQIMHSGIVLLGSPLASWLNSVSGIASLSLAAFLSVRLGFFLGPISAVEGHAKLSRSWTLSRSNFWRLALVFLAVAVPAVIVVLISEYALWGSELEAATRATGSNALAIFKLQYDHSVSIAAMLAIALTAVNALFAGASAAAYQALDAEAGETAASAPASNWGIHRAPAYADAGVHQRIEPNSAGHLREERTHVEEAMREVPEQRQSIAPPEERFSDAAIETAIAPHEDSLVEGATHPETHEAPTETPAAASASDAEPVAVLPPLDPAGLAHAAKEHEPA
jgi:hypothetical protein